MQDEINEKHNLERDMQDQENSYSRATLPYYTRRFPPTHLQKPPIATQGIEKELVSDFLLRAACIS